MTWTILRVSERAPDGTAYEVSGPEDAPVVVLIHGLGLSRRLWDAHLPGFADFRVLTYDLYGHGESAPAPRPVDLTLFAEQILGLLDHLGVARAALVGFSIGGMINRQFARDCPERVSALAILNSPHDRGAEAQDLVEARARTVRDQGAFATFDAALQRWFTAGYLAAAERSGSESGPERVRKWREMVDAESYAGAAWVLAHGVRELINPTPPITHPTFVITSENDTGSTPKMSRDIAAEIPGASLEIIPDLQHLGLMEAPDAFVRPTTAFLERTLR